MSHLLQRGFHLPDLHPRVKGRSIARPQAVLVEVASLIVSLIVASLIALVIVGH